MRSSYAETRTQLGVLWPPCVLDATSVRHFTSSCTRRASDLLRASRKNKPPLADATIPTFIQRPKPEFPPPIPISLLLDDVGPDGNVKATYPPSSHSGDSSTYVSHFDVKVTEKPLPPLPPSASLDVTPVVIARPLPDVPWSVSRDSIEIV